VSQKIDNSLVQIYAIGESSGAEYSDLVYELTLTEKMREDEKGVRIVSSNMGRGLLTIVITN
jgi:hypothetical protein